MVYIQLFITFFKIGLFGFGGGAAMISLIQHDLVDVYHWTTQAEFTNMIAVSQITPGPIGINCATYSGYLATGNALGAFVATIALILPSYILMMLMAKILLKHHNNPYVEGAMSGLRPAVVGLIGAAFLLLVTEETFGPGCLDIGAWVIFAVSFVAVQWLKLNPIYLVLIAAGVGLVLYT